MTRGRRRTPEEIEAYRLSRPAYAREWRKRNKVHARAYDKAWRAANPEAEKQSRLRAQERERARMERDPAYKARILARIREYNAHLRLAILTFYGEMCACCGESCTEFLSIDHIGGGGNRHRRDEGIGRIYPWLYTQYRRHGKYPEGFRVLCHNCNQAMGYYGYCPHGGLL